MPQTEPSRFQQFIAQRRKAVHISQEVLAHQIGCQAGEFISLVERGQRMIALKRVPLLADALHVDRAGLCKLHMAEDCPSVLKTFFGISTAHDPHDAHVSSFPDPSSVVAKLSALPGPLRESFILMLDQAYTNQTHPYNQEIAGHAA